MALPKVTAWSYSRFADYDTCPAKFMYKHLMKLPDPSGPAMARGNTIHKLAEDYTTGKLKTLPPELANFKKEFKWARSQKEAIVEQSWGFKSDWTHIGRPGWFGDDVWFRAKLDLGIIYEDNSALIVDHKTGKKYETNVDQVELFTLATFMRFPTLKAIDTRLWYLDQASDNEVKIDFTIADVPRIKAKWAAKVRPMFADKKFPPKPNQWCFRCNFSKANSGPCKF